MKISQETYSAVVLLDLIGRIRDELDSAGQSENPLLMAQLHGRLARARESGDPSYRLYEAVVEIIKEIASYDLEL